MAWHTAAALLLVSSRRVGEACEQLVNSVCETTKTLTSRQIVLVTIFGNFSAVISGVLAFAFNGVTTGGLSGWKWSVHCFD
jgi:hypothetical protein